MKDNVFGNLKILEHVSLCCSTYWFFFFFFILSVACSGAEFKYMYYSLCGKGSPTLHHRGGGGGGSVAPPPPFTTPLHGDTDPQAIFVVAATFYAYRLAMAYIIGHIAIDK